MTLSTLRAPSCTRPRIRLRLAMRAVAAGLVVLFYGTSLEAQLRLCFPSTTWFGSPTGPTIDGKVVDDPGWRGGFRYVFGNGTATPDAVVQGIRDNAAHQLYLSIEADNLNALYCPTCTASPYPLTIVLLTFDNGGVGDPGTPRLHQLEIHPVRETNYFATNPTAIATDPSGITTTNLAVVNYYSGTATTSWGQKTTPTWAPNNMKVGYLQVAQTYRWYLEVKIPFSDTDNTTQNEVLVPPSGNFTLYVNVLRVINGSYQQSWWPPTASSEMGCVNNGTNCNPHLQTPSPTEWGPSTVDPASTLACKGVSVGSQLNDIFTDNIPNSKIKYTPPPATNAVQNIFHAYVQNTSVDGTGNPKPAPQISATFRIYNYGLGPPYKLWDLPGIPHGAGPISNNPTAPVDISATACTSPGPPASSSGPCILSSGPWVLTSQEIVDYSPPARSHQCIEVELSGGTGAPWQASHVFAVGATVLDPSGHVQLATTGGTSGATPPAWNDAGGTTVDGPVLRWSDRGLGTTFLNNTAVQNMDFEPASKFERVAEISAKGYPPRPPNADGTGNEGQVFDLQVTAQKEVLGSGQTASLYNQAPMPAQRKGKTEGVTSQLTWTAHGCRHTGRFMFVDHQKIELCDPVGAFGYVVRHVGAAPVDNWKVKLTGESLETVSAKDNLYRVRVPQDGVATVTTNAEPHEQNVAGPNLAIFFGAVAAVPQGAFGSAFNTGYGLKGGLEYIATSHFSAEAIVGYYRFPGTITSDQGIYQFSVNGKTYLAGGPFRPFVNGGVGAYKFSPGPTKFGGNIGAGLLYEFTPKVGVQGSYDFDVINTAGVATKFSAVGGELRFVF
jgi:hypothetical protein